MQIRSNNPNFRSGPNYGGWSTMKSKICIITSLLFYRIRFIISIIVLLIPPLMAQTSIHEADRQPKIGLVLSGGGALGFAHIPILKAIDSLEIPIDYITGTSMGGIASALYSIGYTGIEMEHLVKNVDWEEILSDKPTRDIIPYFLKKDDGLYQLNFGLDGHDIVPPSGLIRGQKISLFLSKLTYPFEKVDNFDQLPIPYRCIAVDLLTAKEVVIKEGSLSKAMRSTMAIPTIFNPITWGDSLLIDGGLVNNMPVDVIREMGAEYVIAVNVGRPLKTLPELRTMFDILEQTLVVPSIEKREKNIQDTDLFIEPELLGYNPASFTNKNIENIIAVGQRAAKESLPKLIELKNKLNLVESTTYISISDSVQIFRVNIVGNTSIPFKHIYEKLDIIPGSLFCQDSLISHIQNLRETDYFKTIKYKLNYLDKSRVSIQLVVKELGIPKIHRISIRNNKSISFGHIFNTLGIRIGSLLDIDLLSNRITELYSTGYFETIRYEIEPVNENNIHLIINIDEKPRDILRMGLHYDETNKFVGSINAIRTNLFNTGIRSELTLKLAGLTELSSLLYFLTSKHGISLYPYNRFIYKDIPITIFGATGDKIAIYHNRSTSIGFGFGLNLSHNWDSQFEYNLESMNVTPIVSWPDPEIFPEWKDNIRSVRGTSHFDNLDNVLIPNNGIEIKFNYEGSFQNLGSDIDYIKSEISVDYYKTFSKYNTFHFYSYYGSGNEDLPVYKWHYKSGPTSFVGAIRDELSWYHLSIFRADYRRQLNNNTYLSFIYNIAPNYNLDFYPLSQKALHGYGIGLKYNTALGPIEFIYGRGDLIRLIHTAKKKDVYYLSMGFNFE